MHQTEAVTCVAGFQCIHTTAQQLQLLLQQASNPPAAQDTSSRHNTEWISLLILACGQWQPAVLRLSKSSIELHQAIEGSSKAMQTNEHECMHGTLPLQLQSSPSRANYWTHSCCGDEADSVTTEHGLAGMHLTSTHVCWLTVSIACNCSVR